MIEKKYLPILLALPFLDVLNLNAEEVLGKEPTLYQTVKDTKKGRIVTGTVIDAVDGTPIIGANILVKGTNTGVITDVDGHYSVKVSGRDDILVVTYIGYKKREVPVEDLGIIDIKMTSDNEMLDEVVVVGSGTQKKVSVTGSISTVKGSSLKVPNSSLTSSLAGRLAGVMVNTTSGEPGSSSSFYIRGISTFGGRTEPLIMLDDVEISVGDLNNIPPETIESFSILKDASATAIYGARGANGVMLITTKNGMENSKTKINISLENSINTPMNFPEFVDGATWMEMYNEAQIARNPNAVKKYSDDVIQATRDKVNPYMYPDVDWGDLIFKDMAVNQRANINISGGGSRVTYFMGLNVNHDTGLIDSPKIYSWNNNIDRLMYNFQSNISYKATKTTKIDLRMNAQLVNKKGPNYSTSDLFYMCLSADPISFPAYFPMNEGDTHVNFGNAILSGTSLRTNPYAYMVSSFAQTDANTLNTSLKINQELDFITKGLSANALVNFKNWSTSSYNRTIEPYYYRIKSGSYNEEDGTFELERLGTSGTDYISQSGIGKNGDRTIMLQFQINYNRQFGMHNVGGMLMYMQRDYKSSVLPHRNQGLSGRFTYDYGQKYLAEFNFGYNGTERLPKGDRFEFFPALSLGWVISNEKFFEPFRNKVDNLKLRASYGLVGSDETGTGAGSYLFRDEVTLNSIGFTTGSDWNVTKYGPQITKYSVLNACWEKARKLDVGVDLTLFRDLTITADYFNEYRYDILMQRASWASMFGYRNATPWSNMGRVRSWGTEFSVNYQKQINDDWAVDFRGNFTYVENKYLEKDEPFYTYSWERRTGTPLSSTWGYVAEGLFQSQEEIDHSADQSGLGSVPMVGDIKYRDLDGNGIINSHDQCMISEYGTQPRIQYGIGLNVNYKKFDFGVFFNGSAMRKVMLSGIHPFMQTDKNADKNIFKFIGDNYYTDEKQNFDAEYPRLGLMSTEVANNQVNSTFWMRNGNFIRFKTLEIGYRFKYGRIYLNGDNLAVFSPFKYWDPELSWNSYPLQRTYNIGLQLNF